MKRLFLAASLLAAAAVSALAAPPVIYFSDLTSGPKTGGKDNNGVFVTIVGANFGAARGGSTVAVGGGQAAAYPVWSDTKISFQLGANANTGNITVTTPEGTSNGLRFTVRSGRIFFVDDTSPNSTGSGTYEDPWRSPRSFFTAQQPGDTCYFRSGTYAGQYGSASRPYNVSFYNSGAPSGSADNEIAWVGYPGETALFKANSAAVYNGTFELTSGVQYHVIAGLSMYGKGDGREQVRLMSNNIKLVNNRIEGIKTLSYAMIGVTANNVKIWGNECFGATSANKLDHIIYFEGSSSSNIDVGWNYIHNNDIAVGPVFSWNIGSGSATNIRIHHNKIDCRNSSDVLRLAGIWSGGSGSIYFYDNFIIGAGGSLNNDSSYNAIYVGFGKAYIYNNTFYQCRGAGSNYVVNAYASGSAEVKNNIFYNQSNIRYVNGNATMDSNLYYGGAGSAPSGDAHAVSANPLFVNAPALDFHLQSNSPAIDKGADTSGTSATDYYGIVRAAGKIDLGAVEYYTPGSAPVTPPTADIGTGTTDPGTSVQGVAVGGVVRDLNGKGVAGVALALTGGITRTATSDDTGAYSFTDVPRISTFTIMPAKDGFGFTPNCLTIATLAGDILGRDFVARRIYPVKGHVKDKLGNSLKAATVLLTGDRPLSTQTDDNGYYEFPGLLEGNAYTIAVRKAGYYFEPAKRSIAALTNVSNVWDFMAANISNLLSEGQVKVIGSAAGRGTVNPSIGETVSICFEGADTGKFECRVFTLTGDLVWENSMSEVQNGTFEWVPGSAASGIYVVQVKGPGVAATRKIALLK
jgi:hypothetical protein